MAGVQAPSPDLAGEITGQLLDIGYALRQRLDAEVARLGLTPATARALSELDPDRPSPARDLALQLDCDRSNVTPLVDRLEEARLVERRVGSIAVWRRVPPYALTWRYRSPRRYSASGSRCATRSMWR